LGKQKPIPYNPILVYCVTNNKIFFIVVNFGNYWTCEFANFWMFVWLDIIYQCSF